MRRLNIFIAVAILFIFVVLLIVFIFSTRLIDDSEIEIDELVNKSRKLIQNVDSATRKLRKRQTLVDENSVPIIEVEVESKSEECRQVEDLKTDCENPLEAFTFNPVTKNCEYLALGGCKGSKNIWLAQDEHSLTSGVKVDDLKTYEKKLEFPEAAMRCAKKCKAVGILKKGGEFIPFYTNTENEVNNLEFDRSKRSFNRNIHNNNGNIHLNLISAIFEDKWQELRLKEINKKLNLNTNVNNGNEYEDKLYNPTETELDYQNDYSDARPTEPNFETIYSATELNSVYDNKQDYQEISELNFGAINGFNSAITEKDEFNFSTDINFDLNQDSIIIEGSELLSEEFIDGEDLFKFNNKPIGDQSSKITPVKFVETLPSISDLLNQEHYFY